ncbi:MAG TPA: uroporphyrinogen-III synthase [Bryobacteraceae bacterium]|nr:uroporphyrinogen-III synthase [Bryobacteraceae bacterium]
MRVLALESRRCAEMETLIRRQGGDPFVAASMREVPLEAQAAEAGAFGAALLRGDFDGVILLTGVGTRMLWKALAARYPEEDLRAALKKVTLIVRGPKPSAAIRELGLVPDVLVPEPNTWRELLQTMEGRPEKRVAVQEYGKSNTELLNGLAAQGRKVTAVRVYGWDLPEDTSGLREAAARLATGGFDVVLFTTSMQVVNLMKVAAEEGIDRQVIEALQSAFIGSIGPTTTETLEEYGLRPGFEPSHAKMGLLVNEAAAILSAAKR